MNTFIPTPGFDASHFKGTTLILPSVSIGNVPQLATDLLLATLDLDRVGCIEDENVIPVLGPADQVHRPSLQTASSSSSSVSQQHSTGSKQGSQGTGLSMAVEVFQSKDKHWTIIQQRSPTVHHRSHHYTDNLVQFIKESQFEKVVLLASADGARRIDIQLRAGSPPVRYIASPALSTEWKDKVRGLGIEELEKVAATEEEEARRAAILRREGYDLVHDSTKTVVPASSTAITSAGSGSTSGLLAEQVEGMQLDVAEGKKSVLDKVPRIPNGGIARRLHSLCQEQEVAILTIVKFAMEGDNAPDAVFLANVLNAILNIHVPTPEQVMAGQESWRVPKSWDSLYGNTFHQDMYQ
ncbi:Proteasome assembly chaperone 2 [Mortierella claussenii]|nr:Proteasome assembly chaperone 2 [Mortierella claussenii]